MGALKILAKAGKTADKAEGALPLRLGRATPKTQEEIDALATRVARQMNEEHVRSGKPKDTTNLAGRSMKESKRLQGLDYVVEPTGAAKQSVVYQPRKGDVNVALPGDQTISDSILRRIGDIEGIDSVQQGGAKYGLGKMDLADPLFWASNEVPAQMFQKKVTNVADFYDPERVVGQHLAMGPVANNFAMHFADANLRAIDYSKMKPQQMQQFDRLIANGYYKKNPKTGEVNHIKFDDWPGIADPEGALLAMRNNSELRKWFNNRMKTPDVTQPLGLPNGRDIEWAITEPALRNMEVNLTGLSAGEMVPGASLTDTAAHRTYDKGIRGTALGHQEVLTPFTLSFPDAAQHIASTQRPQDFTGTIQKVFPHQIVDEQYLDELGRYRDLIKKYTGKKKGGLTLKASGGLIKAQLKALREEFAAKDAVIKAQQALDEKKYLKDIEANTLTPENIQKKVDEQKPQKFDEGGAAFGRFPQMSLKRSKQDREASKNVPVDLARGFVSGVLGAPGDLESLARIPYDYLRSPTMSELVTGKKESGTFLPTSEDIEKRLPFKSDTPVSRAATGAGQIAGGFYTGPGSPFKLIGAIPAAVKHGAEEFAKASAMGVPHVVAPGKKSLKAGPFYSSLDEAAEALGRNKGTGKEFMTELRKQPGVKKAEIEDRKLAEIEAAPKMTKQEFLAMLGDRPPAQLEEKVLGQREPFDAKRLAQLEKEYNSLKQHPIDDPSFGEEKYNELIKLMNIRDQSTVDTLYQAAEQATRSAQRAQKQGAKLTADKYFREAEFLNTRAEKLDLQDLGQSDPPKYGNYQMPGGSNYREVLLKLPESERQMKFEVFDPRTQKAVPFETREEAVSFAKQDPTQSSVVAEVDISKPNYKSSHWEDPNVLAHMRVSDRTGPNGEKILHVEEIQSDWHQEGRKKGYGPKTEKTVEAYYETKNGQRIPVGFGKTKEEAEANIDVGWKNLVDIKYETIERKIGEGVPDAPFKKNWHELATKKAMDMAVEGGYDKVVITPGSEQSKRFRLSNVVDEINVVNRTHAGTGEKTRQVALDTTDGRSLRLGVDNNGVVDNVSAPEISNFMGKSLDEIVGKDIANKIMSGGTQTISGEGLQVGGEGMKGFYDQILPAYIGKEYGKYGAKVVPGQIEMQPKVTKGENNLAIFTPNYADVHSIDITPEMREAIKSKGQPFYQAVGAGTAGLATQDFELPDGRKAGGVITSLRRNRNKTESVKNRLSVA